MCIAGLEAGLRTLQSCIRTSDIDIITLCRAVMEGFDALLRYVAHNDFRWFALYRVVMGVVVLVIFAR